MAHVSPSLPTAALATTKVAEQTWRCSIADLSPISCAESLLPGLSPKTPAVAARNEALPGLSPKTPAAGALLHLNVAVAAEPDLQNLEQEGSVAALPSGWEQHRDGKGRAFYFDSVSLQSTWENPAKAFYSELIDFIRKIRLEAPMQAADAVQHRHGAIEQYLKELHARALRDLDGWSGPYISAEGTEYFFSDALQASSWENPVRAWEEKLNMAKRHLSFYLGLEDSSRQDRQAQLPFSRFRIAAQSVVAVQRLRLAAGRKRSYAKDEDLDPDVIRQIDLDMPRTAGGDAEIQSSLGTARSLLLRHAAEDPELGYCQGMNMVAALFAVAARSQSEAYTRFRSFTQNLRGLWKPGFPLLQQAMPCFENLAMSRPWFQHLQRNDIGPELYLPRAWLSLFASSLTLPTRVLLLRHFEQEGLASILAVSLALLDHAGPVLLEQGDDMDEVLHVLETLSSRAPHPAALISARDGYLPAARAAAATARSNTPVTPTRRPPPLRREGSRVLDGRGREALFSNSGLKRHKHSAAAKAGKALLRFSFELPGRRTASQAQR